MLDLISRSVLMSETCLPRVMGQLGPGKSRGDAWCVKLTLAVIVLGGGHVPYSDGDDVGRILLAGKVNNLNDPVLVRGVEVLLQQSFDLLDVSGILAALGGDKVGPEALLVDGGKDDLDDRWKVLWFGGARLDHFDGVREV